ncbi:MAG: desulfoferrodoxin FeS4 iron-binding domain-containing protein [Candidatus Thorarchaeota archaeon]
MGPVGATNMAKEGAIYVCDVCGQVVEVKKSGAGTLVCCNRPMRLYIE